MRYVVPNVLHNFSTNVALEDYAEYSPNTTYNIGDKITVLSEKKNYFCTKDNTTGISPTDNSMVWKSEPINAYAMLDYTSNKKTKNNQEIAVSFYAQNIDFIAFFGVEASSIEIKVEDERSSTIIYEAKEDMSYDDLEGFGDYLFSPKEFKDRHTVALPIFFDMRVDVKIKNAIGMAECGYLCCGRGKELGVSLQNGATSGLKSFAKKERDAWGNVTLVPGAIFDVMDIPVLIHNSQYDIVKNRLKKVDATPCVFIADESNYFTSLTFFGFYRDLEMPISSKNSEYTLRIESILT